MLVDFYGEVLDINGQENYDPIEDLFDDYVEEEELDCRKENDAIFCEQASDDNLPL
ncbi:MAG: hypothetical protein J6W49_04735 [Paludibacteraceae bacterium]|nr:hypothetical protein [Paludibacteraceae bacterium]MBP5742727.1 hypothetical protein [Paludibacteraceae bacterium]